MSQLDRLIRSVHSLFCQHEWARRRDRRRVYLECVHCLATTRGIEYGPDADVTPKPRRRALRAVRA